MSRCSKHPKRSKKAICVPTDYESPTAAFSNGDQKYEWDGDIQSLIGIAHGSAGMVFALDDSKVVKVYLGSETRAMENSETERQAYRNIKRRSYFEHVLKCYDLENPYGLVLERCRESVRRRIASPDYSPEDEALKFAYHAAKALTFIHHCGIVQGDVGCHNMMVDYNGTLKFADFAGSSVDECRFSSSVGYEIGSRLPSASAPTERSDVFALGSAMYEMITRRKPYSALHYTDVQRKFKQGIFPQDFGDFNNLGHIIEKCWGKGGKHYEQAEQVLNDLHKLYTRSYVSQKPTDSAAGTDVTDTTNCETNSTAIHQRCSTIHSASMRDTDADMERYVIPSIDGTGSNRQRKDRKTKRQVRYKESYHDENDGQKHTAFDDGMENISHMVRAIFHRRQKPMSSKINIS